MDKLLESAQYYLNIGNKQSAFDNYRELLIQKPNTPEAWFGISLCINDFLLKTKCLNNALGLKPEYKEAENLLISLYKREEKNKPINNQFNLQNRFPAESLPQTKETVLPEMQPSKTNNVAGKSGKTNRLLLELILIIGFVFIISGIILILTTTQSTPLDVEVSSPVSEQIQYFDTPTVIGSFKSYENTQEVISTLANPSPQPSIDTENPSPQPGINTANPSPQPDIDTLNTLFSDDFSDRTWTKNHWEVEDGIWEILDERFSFTQNGKAFAGNNDWTDYTYSVNMMGVNTIDKILFFRYSDNQHAYYVFLRSYPINDILLAKTTPSYPDHILISKSYLNNFSTWYTVKVKAIGNHIQIFVDDMMVIDYYDNDSPLLTGRIAIMGMLPENGTVFYDNVLVESNE